MGDLIVHLMICSCFSSNNKKQLKKVAEVFLFVYNFKIKKKNNVEKTNRKELVFRNPKSVGRHTHTHTQKHTHTHTHKHTHTHT